MENVPETSGTMYHFLKDAQIKKIVKTSDFLLLIYSLSCLYQKPKIKTGGLHDRIFSRAHPNICVCLLLNFFYSVNELRFCTSLRF